MEPEGALAAAAGPASLVVVDPSGRRKRVPVDPIPFLIGRPPGNDLILRDNRVSRAHARIVVENGGYVLEDMGSRHGTFVNGKRVKRKALENTDRVEFGAQDSYQLLFALDGVELKRLMEQLGGGEQAAAPLGVGSNLAKLRAILDLARTLQSSFSIDEVLASVVDTALTITGAERGFLLLRGGAGAALETRVARNRRGQNLKETDLRVPREVIRRALEQRRELLSMNFEPLGAEEDDLPQALLGVISDEEFGDPALIARREADHRAIDRALASRVGAEADELARIAGPAPRLGPLLRPLNQLGTQRLLREAREKVWANAIALSQARRRGPDTYSRLLAQLEELSAAKVTVLQAPGQVLLKLAATGFGVRLPG